MECRDVRSLADDYLDGALDEATRNRVEAHLAECEGCRIEFDAAGRYRDAVRDLPRVKVPSDFLRGIHDRLDAETARMKGRAIFGKPLPKTLPFGVAAAAIAVFALIFVLNLNRPGSEKPPERGAALELQTAREEKRERAESAVRFEIGGEKSAAPEGTAEEIGAKSPPVTSKDRIAAVVPRPEPLEITLVLDRPAPADGTASTSSVEPTPEAERARGAGADRATEAMLLRARGDELASMIASAGGRIISTDDEGASERTHSEAPVTVLAVLPAPELSGFLDRLAELGQTQTDRAVSLPESTNAGDTVELRIRLTYRPPEGSDTR